MMGKRLIGIVIASVVLLISSAGLAVVELETFEDPSLQARYDVLIQELRCPKCQNQNLAGSDSMVAQDLRREVRNMLEAGESDAAIKDFLVARYGDFVLYRPPLSGATLWVWVVPVIFLVLALGVMVAVIRRAQRSVDDSAVVDEDRIEDVT